MATRVREIMALGAMASGRLGPRGGPCGDYPLQLLPMKSYDVIRQAVEEPGVKAVAAALKVSPALVYKWCEPPASTDDPDQSGAKNPLDRVR